MRDNATPCSMLNRSLWRLSKMRMLLSVPMFFACFVMTGSAQAQDKTCPIPEFNDKPAFCGQSSTPLVELEKSQMSPSVSTVKEFGF